MSKSPVKLNSGSNGHTVLFLGYDQSETRIIDHLIKEGYEVWHTKDRLWNPLAFTAIVSFGYKHIIPQSLIEKSSPIINLHISFLPYNRGSHPNFWSFYDKTPSGVSIHLIDSGIDTGPILVQRIINFQEEKTFAQSYKRLMREIEDLFLENQSKILERSITPTPQVGKGTFHVKADFPVDFSGWESEIESEIQRLRKKSIIKS